MDIETLIAELLRRSTIDDAQLLDYVRELSTVGEPELALVTLLENERGETPPGLLTAIEDQFGESRDFAGRAALAAVVEARARQRRTLAAT